MLPVRLALHNFLPYRAPDPISFEGLHLAVLSGPNGAGKSSLLDAITWALWGRSRARSDLELIALGADDMSVELDFEQNGDLYRVVRQRDRRRRAGALSLFLRDRASGSFSEISAPSLRDTQARLNALLRLDYDTFVHSAFLQQGRADAFTIRPPAQRKQILGDILGLDSWGLAANRARDRLSEIDTALDNIAGRLEQIEEDLARRPRLEQDFATAEADYTEAERTLQEAEQLYDAVKDAPAQLRAASDRLHDLARRLGEYENDERAALAELDRLSERIGGYEAILARQEAIESGFAALETARQADLSLSDKLMAMQDADSRRHALESQIAAARAALEAQAADHRGAIEALDRLTAGTDEIEAELGQVETAIQTLEAREAERDSARGTIADLAAEAATLRSANKSLHEEMNAIKGRMDTLNAADPESALCPTCQQPLSPVQRADLLARYQVEGTARGDAFRANRERLAALHEETAQQEALIQTLQAELGQLNPLRRQAGELRARQETARDADLRRTEARAALASVEAALAAGDYAAEARAQLAVVQAEIETLGYDRAAHTEARENLASFRAYEVQQQELRLAQDALPEARRGLEAAQKRLARLRAVRLEEGAAHAALTEDVERLKALVAEANRRFDEAARARSAVQVAGEKRARAGQALHALEAAGQRRDSLAERRATLLDQAGLYDQLRQAFGRNGIPALIIEAAIPELEADANALLGRMTDGRMRVRLSTQRETVSGETVETLDIAIADEAGLRDYALFSGGEAFRINFALRIALSKLLARRAGAALRTLFVDEGFGTQDAAGRERLVEAINAVAADFDLILVITHMDDLRDAFPARLEVEKTPSGSRVQVR